VRRWRRPIKVYVVDVGMSRGYGGAVQYQWHACWRNRDGYGGTSGLSVAADHPDEAHDRLIEALGETLALENRRYRVIELP
jgi:hypothetical protein